MYERKSVPIAIDSNMRIFEMYIRIGYDVKTCIIRRYHRMFLISFYRAIMTVARYTIIFFYYTGGTSRNPVMLNKKRKKMFVLFKIFFYRLFKNIVRPQTGNRFRIGVIAISRRKINYCFTSTGLFSVRHKKIKTTTSI